ncbi:MAG: succinate dehydrogenase, cytochrome b556 subunit [Deferribacterota bacterium]|nr:succinate dehydrogenase, cytochrome b556 subunit [Deferribacterota bacterium]
MMEGRTNTYKNDLGIWGFVYGGKYTIERYLYTLHRITGLGILLYFILHIFVTYLRVYGAETWESTMAVVENPIFKLGEYLVFIAFVFHALNGLRLFFNELGIGLGEPEPPIFPFSNSIEKHRYVVWIVGIVVVLLAIISFYDFFIY